MPRILANVREQLLAETKRQIETNGYSKTTIRSVAGACKVGVGTVYNYFPSKDMLIASFMLEDWLDCLQTMKECSCADPIGFLEAIYQILCAYIDKHQALFSDSDAEKVFATAFTQRHQQLRDQLAECILPACPLHAGDDPLFFAQYIAESLLTWAVAGKSFAQLSSILKLLFSNKQ